MRTAALFALLLVLLLGGPAGAEPAASSADETAIRAVIATWYAKLQERGTAPSHSGEPGLLRLFAPGAIDGGPRETETRPMSRARSPTISNELAARALKFAYEIDVLVVDPRFAKAIVWERGYFFAWATQKTYESAASAVFVFEKQPDGGWLILAHEATGIGIPPNKRTEPMPDLRGYFYATQGKDRDAAADARGARPF